MRKIYIILVLMAAIPMLMGMGTGSGNVTHKIPTPERNYAATITDSQGISTKVTQISFDGRTYLTGQRGNTTVTVPFEKISTVLVAKAEDDKKMSAAITLKSGGSLNITVDGKLPCYGAAEFGNVQVEFRDIRKVEILGAAAKEKQ